MNGTYFFLFKAHNNTYFILNVMVVTVLSNVCINAVQRSSECQV